VSFTTTIGDRKWKRTPEKTGPRNHEVASKGPEEPMENSGAGSIVGTTIARNTVGRRWTQGTTPDKEEKMGNCPRMTEGTKKEKSGEHRAGGRGEGNNHGNPGRANIGPLKPTGPRSPYHWGKGQ